MFEGVGYPEVEAHLARSRNPSASERLRLPLRQSPQNQLKLSATGLAASVPLSGLIAVGSIVGSAIKIAEHEKKFDKTKRNYIALRDALPQSRKLTMPKGNNNNGNGKAPMRSRGYATTTARAVKAPAAGGMIVTRPYIPRMRSTPNSVIVKNTELIQNVTLPAAGAFGTFNLPLIAGLPSWLTALGDLFSKYRWLRCSLVWVPQCPTSTSGLITAAIVYDWNDAAPSSSVQLSQCYKSISFPPYAGFEGTNALHSASNNVPGAVTLELDTNRVEKPWYSTINNAAFAPLAANIKNIYSPAVVQVTVEGGPAAATVAGNFYIKYEIEFIEPVNPTMNV